MLVSAAQLFGTPPDSQGRTPFAPPGGTASHAGCDPECEVKEEEEGGEGGDIHEGMDT